MKSPVYLFFLLILCSCSRTLTPSRMFDFPSDFQYSDFSGKANAEYLIAPYDLIDMRLFTNEGVKLIELAQGTSSASGTGGIQFTVDKEGNIRVPTIGRVHLQGLTIKQAQEELEKQFSEYYIKPFCLLKVLNRKALVFTGNGSVGSVVTLPSENTSLVELLTIAGGIPQTGKAYKVKLIRGNITNPQVQIVDFSNLAGLRKADINIQANDIVYVEPQRNIAQNVLSQITPVLALLTTALLVVQLVRK